MAAMVLTEKNAESARASIIPVAPASRAAPIASVNADRLGEQRRRAFPGAGRSLA
jgi:hypothetical protein